MALLKIKTSSSTVSSPHLLVGHVDQCKAGGLSQRKTQAVNGVQDGTQEATESQLLPAGQPAVQPVGEAVVLGPRTQLEDGGQQTRQVDQR